MKVKEENEKAGLKLSIQKTKIMISSPITSWQIDGETMKSVTDFIFGGSKITEDGCLLLEKTNLDSILKSKDITDKGLSSQAMFFPGIMYECESWTIKKAEPRRIDAFELWCWRILMRVPWTARRSNQSILKEINSDYSWKD